MGTVAENVFPYHLFYTSIGTPRRKTFVPVYTIDRRAGIGLHRAGDIGKEGSTGNGPG